MNKSSLCIVALLAAMPAAPAAAQVPGVYRIARGPVADGDSSVIALAADGSSYMGEWRRFGDQPLVGLHSGRVHGDTLDITADMGSGPAMIRLTGFRGARIAGRWTRDKDTIAFTAQRTTRPLPATLRAWTALKPFAPGVLSTPAGESFGTLSPDGRELYFTLHPPSWSPHRIVLSRRTGDAWSAPVVQPFSGTYSDREPRLSPDGRRLYFSSNRPAPGDTARRRDLDIWYVERSGDGWGQPQHLGAPVNTSAQEFCPVVTADGTLYFISTRAGGIGGGFGNPVVHHNVWRSRFVNGAYTTPENLGADVNGGFETNVYVTPDQTLMLLSRDGAPDGFGGDDLYASRARNGVWQAPVHLGAPFSSIPYDYGPMISPDGMWVYFTSHRRGSADLYRVSTASLPDLTPPTPAQRRALQRKEDEAGVKRAVQDYLEGLYEGDTLKLVRSIRPELTKYGFYKAKPTDPYAGESETLRQLIDYAVRVKARNRPVDANAPRRIEILDVADQTAAVKLTAWWGIDYIQLAKYDGRWMILHVLWQSPPL